MKAKTRRLTVLTIDEDPVAEVRAGGTLESMLPRPLADHPWTSETISRAEATARIM